MSASMSEEEPELIDLVAQALENNGCLAKIRAQLRASVFLALDEDEKVNNMQPMMNQKVRSALQSPEGQAMFYIVREFLEHFGLDYTLSVYETEAYLPGEMPQKANLMENLGITSQSKFPILHQLIHMASHKDTLSVNKSPSKTIHIDLMNGNGDSISCNGLKTPLNDNKEDVSIMQAVKEFPGIEHNGTLTNGGTHQQYDEDFTSEGSELSSDSSSVHRHLAAEESISVEIPLSESVQENSDTIKSQQ